MAALPALRPARQRPDDDRKLPLRSYHVALRPLEELKRAT
jgi:hypothetical protein